MRIYLFLALTFFLNSTFASLQDQYISADVDQDNFSIESARQFTSSTLLSSGEATKMSLAQVPDEFECPLFSNSPYKDILTALDGLQTSINLFPPCETQNKSNDLMTTISTELRQKIIDAKSLEEKGETQKLGLSAEKILSSATRLQDLITKASSSPACYQTEESKKLIFSINDTFQSIAPLALDFVAKNPALGAALAPYLPVVAGAQAVSKGISVLESALKYVPTLDMKNPENRLAVIKNTCSFMKVYNKVELLTLDRASRLKKINQDFDKKIRASREIKKAEMQSSGAMALSNNPTDQAITLIRDQTEKYQKTLGKATDEMAQQANAKMSDIGLCSVVKTVHALKISDSILSDLVKLAGFLQRADQIAFKKTKLQEFEAEINKPDTFKQISVCAQLGQDWIQAQAEALIEIKSLLSEYDRSTQILTAQSVAQVKISREEKKAANLEADKEKLNLFTDISVVEPGELAKRMRGMPRYLFNGTDGNWFYKVKQNGPVYDLLQDNENSFKIALSSFNNQVEYLKSFERSVLMKQYGNAFPKTLAAQGEFNKKMEAYQNAFTHITTKYATVNSYDHRELCNKSKLAIKFYVEATDHLISNEYLCKMIEPVLKEAEVSLWLKRYCQNSKGLVTNTDVKAGYKELARPLFVKNGPKSQIELIMQKYDQLQCDYQF